jgi:hypothetical protein
MEGKEQQYNERSPLGTTKNKCCGGNCNEISGRIEEKRWAERRGRGGGEGVKKVDTGRCLYTPVKSILGSAGISPFQPSEFSRRLEAGLFRC